MRPALARGYAQRARSVRPPHPSLAAQWSRDAQTSALKQCGTSRNCSVALHVGFQWPSGEALVVDEIYHYTDGKGLLGILASKCIWCTHISYLNDTSEYRIGRNLYRRVLEELTSDATVDAATQRVATSCLEEMRRVAESEESEAGNEIPSGYRAAYVASFSTQRDNLAQWRGYSGVGPRFSIGFRVSALQAQAASEGFKLTAAEYDERVAAGRLRAFVLDELSDANERPTTELGKMLSENGRNPSRVVPGVFNHFNEDVAQAMLPYFKHPAFDEEKEWRLFTTPKMRWGKQELETSFRLGRTFLVPYVKADLSSLETPITSITVGPSPHRAEALAAVKQLVANASGLWPALNTIGSKRILPSKIPYRDW
ncbi:MAG: DUF2971 domain-containing protein [Steroidobacteraceae bacterium]